ncbi:MAG: hypothetical protein RLZZ227_2388 [Pseudomonadota bacterium]
MVSTKASRNIETYVCAVCGAGRCGSMGVGLVGLVGAGYVTCDNWRVRAGALRDRHANYRVNVTDGLDGAVNPSVVLIKAWYCREFGWGGWI